MAKPRNEAPKNDSSKKAEIGAAWSEKPVVIREEKVKDPARKLRQEFDLGVHEVSEKDKVKDGYVSLVTGSVDVIPFSENGKTESFYRNEVTQPCTVLLNLYKNNKRIFTDEAIKFIESNAKLLEAIKVAKPKNEKEFNEISKKFSKEQIYGPDGCLQLLLAFNRVVSKMKVSFDKMADPQFQKQFKIDLRHRENRSVEVTLYSPEITNPNIGGIRLDLNGIEVVKLMKTDGTFEVSYWQNQSELKPYTRGGKLFSGKPASRELAFQLNINPGTKIVQVVRFLNSPGPKSVEMTFDQFNNKVKANTWFLHTL